MVPLVSLLFSLKLTLNFQRFLFLVPWLSTTETSTTSYLPWCLGATEYFMPGEMQGVGSERGDRGR